MTKIGIIAGNGVFPLEVARAARRQGIGVVVVAHSGEATPAIEELADEIIWIKVGELQRMIDALRAAGVEQAAMAGGISRAQLDGSFAPDARALAMLSRIGRFSDDTVLRAVAAEIEADGIRVIDPVPLLTGVLAGVGLQAGPTPTSAQLRDLEIAFSVMHALGAFDIGQTVAVRDGVVAAVEAVEGTDAAMRRAGALIGKGMVVGKAAKPVQDLRFDRPAIGPATIEMLAAMGAALIGVEAHRAMILERERTLELADARGVAVYGHE